MAQLAMISNKSCLSAVGRFGGLSCYGDVTGSHLLPAWGSCLLKEGLGPEGFRELSSCGEFFAPSSAAGKV